MEYEPLSDRRTAWCAGSSGKPTQRPLSWRGWLTRPWIAHLSGTISQPSMAARGADSWISSLRGSRASPTARPAGGAATPTSERSGPTSSASSASASRLRSSSRTSRATSVTSPLFGENYEQWASDSLRLSYIPPTNSERSTDGSGCLFSLPTPTANSYGTNQGGAAGRTGPVRPSLETMVRTLPSPQARDWKGDGGTIADRGGKGPPLNEAIQILPTPKRSDFRPEHHTRASGRRSNLQDRLTALPTPTRSDSRGSAGAGKNELPNAVQKLPTPRATDGSKGGPNQRGRRGDLMLPSAVCRLPTPTAQDSRSSGAAGCSTESGRHSGTTLTDAVRNVVPAARRGRLNPRFSEWMMGLPVGWTSSEPLARGSFLRWRRVLCSYLWRR